LQKNPDISAVCNGMINLQEIWHDDAKHVSQVHWLLKNLSLKIQDGERPIGFKEPSIIMRDHDF